MNGKFHSIRIIPESEEVIAFPAGSMLPELEDRLSAGSCRREFQTNLKGLYSGQNHSKSTSQ
jgi:hypothetical protein